MRPSYMAYAVAMACEEIGQQYRARQLVKQLQELKDNGVTVVHTTAEAEAVVAACA